MVAPSFQPPDLHTLTGGASIVNRVAMLGASVASLGFFFLPLIELKPNRIASGISFQLLQLEGDLRFVMLFVLALAPLVVALRPADGIRGWLLSGLGNLLLFLTLFLPAVAGERLLRTAAELLGEGMVISNPRLLPSAALALGLVGGYVVLFGGLRDLSRAGVSQTARLLATWGGVVLIALFFISGQFDVYSVMVEFEARGEQLGRSILEHLMFVMVSLVVGFFVGVGLGLWAHRDAHVSPMILYAVGIIQTIPSLALFGLLLAPLARLGNQRALSVGIFFVISLVVAAGLLLAYRRLAEGLAGIIKQVWLILGAVALALPLALFVVVFASFAFQAGLLILVSSEPIFGVLRLVMFSGLLAGLALWALSRFLRPRRLRKLSRYLSWVGYGVFGVALLFALFRASGQVLAGVEGIGTLTIRDLGVAGIGTAPAVIALTLYSLLPLVRNTYAGLSNVDPAIIDSGRGMGMNATQRFLQLELPIAFPVIMAGVRNAAVALVGIGTIAAVIGAGGLGDFILLGIYNTSIDLILLGAIPAVLLAVALDTALLGLERLLVSPGIGQLEETP